MYLSCNSNSCSNNCHKYYTSGLLRENKLKAKINGDKKFQMIKDLFQKKFFNAFLSVFCCSYHVYTENEQVKFNNNKKDTKKMV